jgi:hypothetical protein
MPRSTYDKIARFEFGRVEVTGRVVDLMLEYGDVVMFVPYIRRHLTGDWGNVDAHDREINNRAIREGGRIFSQYILPRGERLWIATEADRSVTTVLLPEEY